jgi:hypothetical protein
MTAPPTSPSLFHITHVANLPAILAAGGLRSDAGMLRENAPVSTIGMGKLKQRRLARPVPPHPGTAVGDYVPFYFCPRSVMLYILHKGNHPEVSYRGGQGPIVHLEADLHAVVARAAQTRRRWAFSEGNASASYAMFHAELPALAELDWGAIAATNFTDPGVRDAKQAEFLVHEFFDWELVHTIGVIDATVKRQVEQAIAAAPHRPVVAVRRSWYY